MHVLCILIHRLISSYMYMIGKSLVTLGGQTIDVQSLKLCISNQIAEQKHMEV